MLLSIGASAGANVAFAFQLRAQPLRAPNPETDPFKAVLIRRSLPQPIAILLRLNALPFCLFWTHALDRRLPALIRKEKFKKVNATNATIRFGNSINNVRRRRYYSLISSQFFHVDPSHFFSNMLALCSMGPSVLEYLGKRRFRTLIITAAVTGAASSLAHTYLMRACGKALHSRAQKRRESHLSAQWRFPSWNFFKAERAVDARAQRMHAAADDLIGNASLPGIGFSGIVCSLIPAYYRILCNTELSLRREFLKASSAGSEARMATQAQQAKWVTGARQPLVGAWVTTVAFVLVTPLAAVSEGMARIVTSTNIGHGAHLGGLLTGWLLLPKKNAVREVTLDANVQQLVLATVPERIGKETLGIACRLFALRSFQKCIWSGLVLASKAGSRLQD